MQTSAFFHNHAPLNSYKRDKTLTTQVLVRGALKTEEQPASAKIKEMLKTKTEMDLNPFRNILIFPTIHSTT